MNANFNTAPTASAPTISSAAMLAELSMSVWLGRKKDKRASDDVTYQSHAAKGVASVNKKLLGDCAELTAIQKFVGNVRTTHYASTMPWSDTGLRLLPTAQYFKYHEQMTALQNEFDRLVQVFLDAYDWEVMQAQTKLGALFNRDEYPTVDSLRGKFAFRLNYIPVPDAGDWRVDMGNETQNALRDQYQKFYEKQMHGAMSDLNTRLHEQLLRMVAQLEVTPDRKGKVYQSTIDNINNLIDLLGATNYTNDPMLQLAEAKLRSALYGADKDDLVRNPAYREATKKQVEEAIKSLPSLDL
jgi:hypothetical protein